MYLQTITIFCKLIIVLLSYMLYSVFNESCVLTSITSYSLRLSIKVEKINKYGRLYP